MADESNELFGLKDQLLEDAVEYLPRKRIIGKNQLKNITIRQKSTQVHNFVVHKVVNFSIFLPLLLPLSVSCPFELK